MAQSLVPSNHERHEFGIQGVNRILTDRACFTGCTALQYRAAPVLGLSQACWHGVALLVRKMRPTPGSPARARANRRRVQTWSLFAYSHAISRSAEPPGLR